MPQENTFIDHHSGEIQDIIGRIPSWTARRGTIVIACLVGLLIVGAWLIRYPDVVRLPLTLASSNPPVKIIANATGKIAGLYIKNDQLVKAQDTIGWIEKQVPIIAPVSGRLMYLSASEYATTGEPVFVVIPETPIEAITLKLPIQQADRVKAGQEVMIRLRQYPVIEYGMLQANIESISSIPLDSSFIVLLQLKNGAKSTKAKVLNLRHGMTGTAEIITSDKSILQRIFNGIYGPLER